MFVLAFIWAASAVVTIGLVAWDARTYPAKNVQTEDAVRARSSR